MFKIYSFDYKFIYYLDKELMKNYRLNEFYRL